MLFKALSLRLGQRRLERFHVNHFLLASRDSVAQVASEWRSRFVASAALLALTEALGSWLAIQLVREGQGLA